MLALDLLQPIADYIEEVVVGGENVAAGVELDDGLRLADRGDLSLQLGEQVGID